MKKLKVLTVIGTRPEIIRLSETIKELDRCVDHVLVHTGQNYDYELNEIFFKDLGLRKPDYFLQESARDLSPAARVGAIISGIDPILEQEKPDAFLVLGDTNSCLAAYGAKRRKIPVFHMEAGNRSFDERVPEELNRRIIDHISDINMVYSERSRDNLLREGFPPDRIIATGSPMVEVIKANEKNINASGILKELSLAKNDFFVVSFHREENVENEGHFKNLFGILNELAEVYGKPIIFSAHPRTRRKIEESGLTLLNAVRLMKPMGFYDYLALQKNSFCVLSDSGTISEESSILDFPALNIREAHERPEAMDEASVVMTGLNKERVMQALEFITIQHRNPERVFRIPDAYTSPSFSKKVLRIILSYTDYVNKKILLKRD